MLKFRRIEIENFACFDELILEPSTDPDRPLTVIRAENGSGKTTFLRALRWAMYGEDGLPGVAARFSLHPASWQPDEKGIKTQVMVEFETDGSTRDHIERGSTRVFQLVRSVRTIGQTAAKDDQPDYRRINETIQLMVKESDGTWSPHESGVELVVDVLLPWDLRDFFVMDADEATDFVGGGEAKPMKRHVVEEKTTAAVQSLLGIDVFKMAHKRVTAIGQGFGAAAAKSIGDANVETMQNELTELRDERAELISTIEHERDRRTDIKDRLEQGQDDLEREVKDVGAAEGLAERLADVRALEERAKRDRKDAVALLARDLEAPDLLGSLAITKLNQAYAYLKPLYDKGHIPLKHLEFVRGLLISGKCVCGEDLTGDDAHRHHVEARIAESESQEVVANYLGHLHDAARDLITVARKADNSWLQRRQANTDQLLIIEEELSGIGMTRREIESKLDSIDQEKIQVIRDEIDALKQHYDTLNRDLSMHEGRLTPLESKIDSLQKKIQQRLRHERAAAEKRAAQNVADLVANVLDAAYRKIQMEQVKELSTRMNRLFAQMAANVTDDDFDEVMKDKATLRMIAKVGLRPVEGNPERFEIFALNNRGRAMPPIEINGASRRVLALAFVLALCRESRTEAPLIADSLLNSMSGAVRRNTLKATAENSSQPILLLTNADLDSQSEIETVGRMAGATYTLTGQWDAVGVGESGNVINQTKNTPVAILCSCGPRQYCDVCERAGQSEAPGWNRRETELS